MSITFLCGSVNHWKNCQISQVVVFLTNPRRSFKTCFLPPCRCSLTFPLHSARQPVGVRVWVHVGPPHLSRVFERVLGFQRGQPSRDGAPFVGSLVLLLLPIPTQLVPQVAEEFWIKRFGSDVRDHLRCLQVYRHAFHVFHFVP